MKPKTFFQCKDSINEGTSIVNLSIMSANCELSYFACDFMCLNKSMRGHLVDYWSASSSPDSVKSSSGFPSIRCVLSRDWVCVLVRRWRAICGRRCGWFAAEVKVHKHQTDWRHPAGPSSPAVTELRPGKLLWIRLLSRWQVKVTSENSPIHKRWLIYL